MLATGAGPRAGSVRLPHRCTAGRGARRGPASAAAAPRPWCLPAPAPSDLNAVSVMSGRDVPARSLTPTQLVQFSTAAGARAPASGDDTAHLQQLLDDASASGGLVQLPPGPFTISQYLNVSSHVVIQGTAGNPTPINQAKVNTPVFVAAGNKSAFVQNSEQHLSAPAAPQYRRASVLPRGALYRSLTAYFVISSGVIRSFDLEYASPALQPLVVHDGHRPRGR
jgi:hypothetical protein